MFTYNWTLTNSPSFCSILKVCRIVGRDDSVVNAKSIMGVITMAAGYNTVLTLRTEGPDESEAASAIVALFESKFEEE